MPLFEEKVTTYLEKITAPAIVKFEAATPFRAIERMATEQPSPLKFPDTLSARYNINDVSTLLRGKRVANVGIHGTGSHILDFASRTDLGEIALLDDDKVHVHTIFRQPGFPSARATPPAARTTFFRWVKWSGCRAFSSAQI
jgi:hypothetical protein